MPKNIFLVIIFLLLYQKIYPQNIKSVLKDISILKNEIIKEEILLKNKFKTLFVRDQFENEEDYFYRMSDMPLMLDSINNGKLGDLKSKLLNLRTMAFKTVKIRLDLDPKNFDADKGEWSIKVNNLEYKKESIELILNIEKEDAGNLWKNKNNLLISGILAFDYSDKISLVKVIIEDFDNELFYELKANLIKTVKADSPNQAVISNNYKYLAYSNHRELIIFNLETDEIKDYYGHTSIDKMEITQDDKNIIAFGAVNYDYPQFYIYNLEAGKFPKEYHKIPEEYQILKLSSDGQFYVAQVGLDINLYFVKTGKRYDNITTLIEDDDYLYDGDIVVSFSPDCKSIALGISYKKKFDEYNDVGDVYRVHIWHYNILNKELGSVRNLEEQKSKLNYVSISNPNNSIISYQFYGEDAVLFNFLTSEFFYIPFEGRYESEIKFTSKGFNWHADSEDDSESEILFYNFESELVSIEIDSINKKKPTLIKYSSDSRFIYILNTYGVLIYQNLDLLNMTNVSE